MCLLNLVASSEVGVGEILSPPRSGKILSCISQFSIYLLANCEFLRYRHAARRIFPAWSRIRLRMRSMRSSQQPLRRMVWRSKCDASSFWGRRRGWGTVGFFSVWGKINVRKTREFLPSNTRNCCCCGQDPLVQKS